MSVLDGNLKQLFLTVGPSLFNTYLISNFINLITSICIFSYFQLSLAVVLRPWSRDMSCSVD